MGLDDPLGMPQTYLLFIKVWLHADMHTRQQWHRYNEQCACLSSSKSHQLSSPSKFCTSSLGASAAAKKNIHKMLQMLFPFKFTDHSSVISVQGACNFNAILLNPKCSQANNQY
jgi:hypothetical protein